MTITMADYVLAVEPDVPSSLVSAPAMAQILKLAKALPPCPLAGFECRLGARQSPVDFQVEVPHGRFEPPSDRNDRRWAFIKAFCEEWLEESSVLSRGVMAVGLEFDVDHEKSLPPATFVGFSKTAKADTELLIATIERLMERQKSFPNNSAVRSCIQALPSAATIKFVGTMPSRATNALRVIVAGLPSTLIADYLRSLHWQHPTKPLMTIVGRLTDVTDDLTLCLDFTDRLHSRIGIECVLYRQPPNEPRWDHLLKYLKTLGVCSEAKHHALLLWHGDTLRSLTTKHWPPNLVWGDQLLGAKAISTFYRYISHLKLVYEPDRPLEAKAYLGFFHQWVDTTELETTWEV